MSGGERRRGGETGRDGKDSIASSLGILICGIGGDPYGMILYFLLLSNQKDSGPRLPRS
ncbi:hypothetical protein BDZ45DRAFT_303294 [Acephala macrosclerotiorum]|nr:hypothetical protein BDZ45DRAFT_303294 [Acephala macrosclerotiorum]